MNRFIESILTVLEKKTIIKNVFSIPKEGFRSQKFIQQVDKTQRHKNQYISDIDSYIEYFKKHFPEEFKSAEEYSDLNSLLLNPPVCKFDDATIYEVAYCKILMLLYVVQGYIETDYSNEALIKNPNSYFRGQSNYSYGLLPSIYRDLKYEGVIDYHTLDRMYKDTSFFNKYNHHIERISNVNYSFLAFIQHAVAYSPFLDFSEDLNIALIFATTSEGLNYNSYLQTDAGLYSFHPHNTVIPNENIDEIIKEHNVQYCSKRLNFASKIFGKSLLECGIDDFNVELYSFTSPTNDRMKYQKGVFLYFKKCVIVNKELFFPYSCGYITKSKIPCKLNLKKSPKSIPSKEEIYNNIVTHSPSLDINHLLNPYQAFTEYTR
jgi:hypothetical protein